MSIFDVIKYPISDPPTREELRALPIELFEYILNKREDNWRSFNLRHEQRIDVMVYAISKNGHYYHLTTSIIRKAIEEYNEYI